MKPVLRKLKEKNLQLLKSETGTINKIHSGKVSIALVYPNSYKIGMSNLGFQKVYSILNKEENIVCERVFLPEKDDIKIIEKNNLPLFSLESQTPIIQFDIIAFSVTFELDYLNILKILDLANIPLRRIKRDTAPPLIITGGVSVTFNPEPIAEFMDMIIIGEGEITLPEVIKKFTEHINCESDEKMFFNSVKKLKGVYIPWAYKINYNKDNTIKEVIPDEGYPKTIIKNHLKTLNDSPTSSQILTQNTVFSNMYLIEVQRGCPMKCNFCVGGHLYHSLKECSLEKIIEMIKEGKKITKKIGLIGMALGNYPKLEELCSFCLEEDLKVSFSSLRIDMPLGKILNLLKNSGTKTITFAPEAGSERLRWKINKKISNNQIIESVSKVFLADIPNIKLYFLIGLPYENDHDIKSIIDLTKKIKETMLNIAIKKHKIGTITLSINPFIPKPATPYQHMPMNDVRYLEKKIKIIRLGLKKVDNVKVTYGSPRLAYIQGVLSMGDRRVGDILLKVHELNGNWKEAFNELNIDKGFYIYRERKSNEIPPWNHIDRLLRN